jgi:branched-chain amino acid transport system substrate-binding protein
MYKIEAIMKYLLLLVSSVLLINPVVAKEAIVIGLDADMSAVAKEGGIAIQRGALIAINEINQAGGVLGRELTLQVRDHRGNPARGIANIKYFGKQDNVVAVLGGVHTPVALQELPFIHENKLIYLDPWAAGTPIVDNGFEPNYVFRISVRDEQAGSVLLTHAKNNGYKKVGLLLEKTGWGRSNDASMTAAASTLELEIVERVWFHWGVKSLEKEINELINLGAETIVLVANAPEGAVAANTILSLDKDKRVPIISHWGIASGAFVEKVGIANLNALDISVLQTYHFAQPFNPLLNTKVLEQYKTTFDSEINANNVPGAVGTAHAYDLVHLLAIAIKKAGNINSEEVRNALENIEQYSGLVKNYSPPFTATKHDALWAEDYIMTQYNEYGHLQSMSH